MFSKPKMKAPGASATIMVTRKRCILLACLTTIVIVRTAIPGDIPNDPQFNHQWNLKRISATNAWAVTTGSTNVVVAVVDTGINYKHPDLATNMWRNPGE